MPLPRRLANAARTVAPYGIGLTVWGGSVVLMVHGLRDGAWYGYGFALLLPAAIGSIGLGVLRARRIGRRESRRAIAPSTDPVGRHAEDS